MQLIYWLKAAEITAIDYFRNTSLTGFKLIFYLNKSKFLKLLWIPFLLTGVLAAIYITGHYVWYFLLNPTVTYINTFDLDMKNVPFPAVSICSVNKISNQAIRNYAKSIYNQTSDPAIDEGGFIKKFDSFGAFYEWVGFDIDETYDLQMLLNKVSSPDTGYFNVKEVLKQLAPKCEDLLRKCSWAGKTQPCSELFKVQATPEGFCCVFNYERTARHIQPVAKKLPYVDKDLGLRVLLNSSLDDYFFTRRSTLGFVVQVFNNIFFPDILTGKLTEFLVPPNTDMLAAQQVTALRTENEVRVYNIGQRRCYFNDEFPSEFGAYYSQPECLLKCKILSIQSLCNCVPYYTPPDYIDWEPPIIYCSLAHLECLSRYKQTWSAYRPATKTKGLEQEMEDALDCDLCFLLCNTHEYETMLDRAPLSLDSGRYDEFLANETDLENASLLRMFYSSPYAMQYRKRTLYTVNGLFANIGGILSISIGCSLISVIELCYFATVKFYVNIKKLRMISSVGTAIQRKWNAIK